MRFISGCGGLTKAIIHLARVAHGKQLSSRYRSRPSTNLEMAIWAGRLVSHSFGAEPEVASSSGKCPRGRLIRETDCSLTWTGWPNLRVLTLCILYHSASWGYDPHRGRAGLHRSNTSQKVRAWGGAPVSKSFACSDEPENAPKLTKTN